MRSSKGLDILLGLAPAAAAPNREDVGGAPNAGAWLFAFPTELHVFFGRFPNIPIGLLGPAPYILALLCSIFSWDVLDELR